MVGLLKTKVKAANLGALYVNMFRNWCFSSNNAKHRGGRIIISWNPLIFLANIKECSSHFMHLDVCSLAGKEKLLVTFVYAFNEEQGREILWEKLKELVASILEPWIMLGDFNDIFNSEERLGWKVKGCR